jgi:hypothetical protein
MTPIMAHVVNMLWSIIKPATKGATIWATDIRD